MPNRCRLLSAIVLCAGVQIALAQPPSISWTYQWDFNNGLQGWTLNASSGAHWVDPAIEPSGAKLADGSPSGSGAGNLYLPNYASATLPMTAIGRTNVDKFVIQADIFIPNLRPLGLCHGLTCYGVECCGCPSQFAFCHYPGNINHLSGIGVRGPTTLGILGDLGNCRQMLWDDAEPPETGLNDRPGPLWVCEQYEDACNTRPVPPYNDFPVEICWWDKWITVYMDYNWTAPDAVIAWARIPWTGGRHDPRYSLIWPWVQIIGANGGGRPDPHGPRLFNEVFVGWPNYTGREPWTQCQFDNVKLAVGNSVGIPEVCNNHVDDDLDGLLDCEDPDCLHTLACPCNNPFADADEDGDVDQSDFGYLQKCLTGPSGGVPPGCACFDRPEPSAPDNDIDLNDFVRFQACFSGPGYPANKTCDN